VLVDELVVNVLVSVNPLVVPILVIFLDYLQLVFKLFFLATLPAAYIGETLK
jgi:hypothetical protein